MNVKHCPNCGDRMIKRQGDYEVKHWWCPNCEATAPLRRTPTQKPDMTARLGPERLAWLRKRGIQTWIKKQVDEAMSKEE